MYGPRGTQFSLKSKPGWVDLVYKWAGKLGRFFAVGTSDWILLTGGFVTPQMTLKSL